MNVLVIGANGQLGSEIKALQQQYKHWKFLFADLPEVDITNKEAVEQYIVAHNVNAMVNCAAYTAVDKAETDIETATKVNELGPKLLAALSKQYQLKFVHISTDFVFKGDYYLPYTEDDETSSESVYGITKRNGELKALEAYPETVVIRTAWLYSQFGNNFVKTMRTLGKDRTSLNVVYNQIGTPTWAADLALVVLTVLSKLEQGENLKGVYHYSNEGVASWYDFAVEIMKLSNLDCKVFPIEAIDYPTPAPRPAFSVLNKKKIKKDLAIDIPYWKESLVKCIQLLETN